MKSRRSRSWAGDMAGSINRLSISGFARRSYSTHLGRIWMSRSSCRLVGRSHRPAKPPMLPARILRATIADRHVRIGNVYFPRHDFQHLHHAAGFLWQRVAAARPLGTSDRRMGLCRREAISRPSTRLQDKGLCIRECRRSHPRAEPLKRGNDECYAAWHSHR